MVMRLVLGQFWTHWQSVGHKCTQSHESRWWCAVLFSLSWQLKGYISLMENYHQWILLFHHMVYNHLRDEQGPFVTIHIPGLHWVTCFICIVVLASKCMNTWSLIISHFIVHITSMIFQMTVYSFMPTYFIIFGMTVYVNISVIYPLIQADPSRPTYPLCVPTAWGILTWRHKLSSLISGPQVL